MPLGADDDDAEQDGLENLGGYVGDDDDQVAQVAGIGIDAGGNASGGELVVERQVMLDGGTERQGAQVEDDVAHGADRQAAADPVDAPVADADEQHDQPDQQTGSQGGMPLERVQAFADHDRFCRRNDRHQDGQPDDDSHSSALGSEITDDAACQVAVGILPVVLFFVESFVETHTISCRGEACFAPTHHSRNILEYASDVFINSS